MASRYTQLHKNVPLWHFLAHFCFLLYYVASISTTFLQTFDFQSDYLINKRKRILQKNLTGKESCSIFTHENGGGTWKYFSYSFPEVRHQIQNFIDECDINTFITFTILSIIRSRCWLECGLDHIYNVLISNPRNQFQKVSLDLNS